MKKAFYGTITILIIIISISMILIGSYRNQLKPNEIQGETLHQKFMNVRDLWQNATFTENIVKDVNNLIDTFKLLDISETINELAEDYKTNKRWYEIIGDTIYLVGRTILNYLYAPMVIFWYLAKILIVDIMGLFVKIIRLIAQTMQIIGAV